MSFEQPLQQSPEEAERIRRNIKEMQEKTNYYHRLAERYFGPGQERLGAEPRELLMPGFWGFRPGSPEERVKKSEERNWVQDMQKGSDWKEHFDGICQEYKIHLQPIKSYDQEGKRIRDFREKCVAHLMEAIAKDKQLAESLDIFKVSYRREVELDEQINKGEVMPEIVIYPRLGRNNFEKALERITFHFQGWENGSGLPPRANYRINGLIFVAQSGGDFKGGLKKIGELDKYFDKKFNYSFRIGEKPPGFRDISAAGNFTELFKLLNQFRGLQGTQQFYETVELKRLINSVRAGKDTIDILPRADGLREKVEELLLKK